MICPHCKMATTPMGTQCEFCGEDVRMKPMQDSDNQQLRKNLTILILDCIRSNMGKGMDVQLKELRVQISEQAVEKFFRVMEGVVSENKTLHEALQAVCGHTQCYCEICKDISSRYWRPR